MLCYPHALLYVALVIIVYDNGILIGDDTPWTSRGKTHNQKILLELFLEGKAIAMDPQSRIPGEVNCTENECISSGGSRKKIKKDIFLLFLDLLSATIVFVTSKLYSS